MSLCVFILMGVYACCFSSCVCVRCVFIVVWVRCVFVVVCVVVVVVFYIVYMFRELASWRCRAEREEIDAKCTDAEPTATPYNNRNLKFEDDNDDDSDGSCGDSDGWPRQSPR